jgi:hypothetical protein
VQQYQDAEASAPLLGYFICLEEGDFDGLRDVFTADAPR